MACERTVFFAPGESEPGSVLANPAAFEAAVRAELPPALKDLPLKFDTARHVHRPGAHAPAAGQNFLYDPATGKIRSLDDRELFRRIAISFRVSRIYALDHRHQAELAAAAGPPHRHGLGRRDDEYVGGSGKMGRSRDRCRIFRFFYRRGESLADKQQCDNSTVFSASIGCNSFAHFRSVLRNLPRGLPLLTLASWLGA